jgi:hypothetical protein
MKIFEEALSKYLKNLYFDIDGVSLHFFHDNSHQ